MENVIVKVTAKQDGKTYAKSVTLAIRPVSLEDVNKLATEHGSEEEKKDPKKFLFNAVQNYIEYARGVRTTIRNTILSAIGGPGESIDKAVKALVAAGFQGGNQDKVREFVLSQMKAQGLPTTSGGKLPEGITEVVEKTA